MMQRGWQASTTPAGPEPSLLCDLVVYNVLPASRIVGDGNRRLEIGGRLGSGCRYTDVLAGELVAVAIDGREADRQLGSRLGLQVRDRAHDLDAAVARDDLDVRHFERQG